MLLFESKNWLKELTVYVLISTSISISISFIFPFPYVIIPSTLLKFFIFWRLHKRAVKKREQINNISFEMEINTILFELKNWWKELAIIIIVGFSTDITTSLIFPFPYDLPIDSGVLYLIIWMLHKRAVKKKVSVS